MMTTTEIQKLMTADTSHLTRLRPSDYAREAIRGIESDMQAMHQAARVAAERREKAELATIELNERTKRQNQILEEQNQQLKETNQYLLRQVRGATMSERDKFSHLIDEIDDMIAKNISTGDPQFSAWQNQVERMLLKKYGENGFEYKSFANIRFFPIAFTSATTDEDLREICVSDLKRAKAILKTYVDDMSVNDPSQKVLTSTEHYEYDVFLSHASKNKKDLVDSLHDSLNKLGVTVWYDSKELEWGDNWKAKIQEGLLKCRLAIVVLSPEFINREWTEKELTELLNRQNGRNQKLVLPLLYNLTVEEMKAKYPALETIQAYALSKEDDVKDVTIRFGRIFIKELKSEMQA